MKGISTYKKVNGGVKKVNFPRKVRAVLTVEAVVALIVALLAVTGVDVPVEVATALIVVIGWVVGLFTNPAQDERVGYELGGKVHLFNQPDKMI